MIPPHLDCIRQLSIHPERNLVACAEQATLRPCVGEDHVVPSARSPAHKVHRRAEADLTADERPAQAEHKGVEVEEQLQERSSIGRGHGEYPQNLRWGSARDGGTGWSRGDCAGGVDRGGRDS